MVSWPPPPPPHRRFLTRLLSRGWKVVLGFGAVLAIVTGTLSVRAALEHEPYEPRSTDVALSSADTPSPGLSSEVLGYGDSAGGRPTTAWTGGMLSAPPTPVFNSFTDLPYGRGDERMFLRVAVLPPGERPMGESFLDADEHLPLRRVDYRPGKVAWVQAYVHNNADEQTDCQDLSGPTVAHGVTVRVVQTSGERSERVFRVWVAAENATPAWITDAAVINTPDGRVLTFRPDLSYVYSKTPGGQIAKVTTAIFNAGGMKVGRNGDVGSCWDNVVAIKLAFTLD